MAQVSIIMPCHNGEKYIGKAIESVQAQTFTDWELLVIDDFSDDSSPAIVSSMAERDSRIRLLINDRTTRMPATPRNVGIKEAAGRYIAFLDCDDMWLPEKLAHQLPLFEEKNCGAVFSLYKKMDEAGNVTNTVISPASADFRTLLKGNCIGNLTGIYDTAKVGKVYQKEIHHEDYLMWLEILRKGFIARNTGTVEGFYRVSSTSVSGSKLKVFGWTWDIYRKELKLPLPEAAFNFFCYAVNGVLKLLK